jgi:hypothetical protein
MGDRIKKIRALKKGTDIGSCPLGLGKEVGNHTLLRCRETNMWRAAQINNIRQYFYRGKHKWENKVRKIVDCR